MIRISVLVPGDDGKKFDVDDITAHLHMSEIVS